MHDILNVPEGEKISSKYSSGEKLAKALISKVGREKAVQMINYAANASSSEDVFDSAQNYFKKTSEK